ncbi:MAG: tyrosine-type recombinase/integrase [Phocaeicola sp.]|uniref:site-specific integrase n=1 Tax=Phocaeicola sp. TaxID=2773926 RepID=UPI003F9EBEA6
MQKDKMKVLLYLKKSGLDKSGQAPIMGRITYNRTMAQFSSKLSCNPKLWNTRESRLNGKSREAVTTNAKLEQLLLSVQRAYQTLCDRGIEFPAKEIKEQFQGSMQGRATFLQRYDQIVEEEKKLVGVEISKRWHSVYYMIRKHLQVFIQERYHTNDITFGQLTEDFLDGLHQYSVGRHGHSQSYYRKMTLAIKKVCRLAFREGLIDRPLFDLVKIDRGESKLPRALDRSSLEKILNIQLEDYEVELSLARNLFLFTCYTGTAFCDMMNLSKEHLVQDDAGAMWLKFRRQKTDTLCRVKLLPQAIALLDTYHSDEQDRLLPTITYETYRFLLKALQLKAGISIPLTAHVGRHTFATLITLENGVPIETVSKMLGHSKIETTERYAHVTPTKVFEEFGRFLSSTADLTLSL